MCNTTSNTVRPHPCEYTDGGKLHRKIIMWASTIGTRAVCRYNMSIQERDTNKGKKMTTNDIITMVALSGVRSALTNSGKWVKNNAVVGQFIRKATNRTKVSFWFAGTIIVETSNASKKLDMLSALKTINALNAM